MSDRSRRAGDPTAVTFKQEFIVLEKATDFVEELGITIAAVGASFECHNASKTALSDRTQQIDNAMDRVMAVLEQLNPIVKNKPEGDAVGIQNRKKSRHVERAWVNKKPEETKQLVAPAAAA